MKFYSNSPIAILSLSNNLSTVVYANNSFLKMFDFAFNHNLIGEKLSDICVFNSSGRKHLNDKLVREGLLFDEKMFCFTNAGRMITCLVSMQEDKEGEETIKTLFFHNITELHNLEIELEKSKQLADKALSMQALFLANVSHEIRTPINGILGFTELLQRTELTNEQKDYLHSIDVSGKNLIKIVADILDATKIEAGLVTLEHIKFSLRDKLKELIQLFNPQFLKRQIIFDSSFSSDLPEEIYGDPLRLFQILNNLLSNALKFTPSGGSIRFNAEVAQSNKFNVVLKLQVIDTGIGIEPDKLKLIFDKFIQADNSTTRKYGGTGLGLSIVKKLVELHKGTIHVDSEKNKGSNFYCFLPYSLRESNTHTEDLIRHTSQSSLLNNKKILLVEDNEINQKLTSTILGQEGAVVTLADNGEVALKLLQNIDYDLILMDIQMPVLDGITSTIKIRKELQIDTPIIAMTANVIAGEKKVCLSSGMNDYISKPFNSKDLLNRINRQLANSNGSIVKSNKVIDGTGNDSTIETLNIMSSGNKAFVKEMIELFMEQCPGDIEKLTRLIKTNDYSGIGSMAHRLQTSLALMGFNSSTITKLKQIESLCTAEQNINEVKHLTYEVINDCKFMLEKFSGHLNELNQIS